MKNYKVRIIRLRLPLLLFLLELCFSISPISLFAEDLSWQAGAFAPVALGARGPALAGAQAASAQGMEALAYNPALVSNTANWELGYTYSNLYGLLPYHFTGAQYALPKTPYSFGLAWIQNGDDIYSENELRFAGATKWHWIQAGLSYKLRFAGTGSGGTDFIDPELGLNRKVSASALGLSGFDLGLVLSPLGERYLLALVMRDLGSYISWDSHNQAGTTEGSYGEFISPQLVVGFRFKPDKFLEFNSDIRPPLVSDQPSNLANGIEILPFESLSDSKFKTVKSYIHDVLALRMGYSRNLFTRDANHQLNFGLGFSGHFPQATLSLDLAYTIPFVFQDQNTLQIGFRVSR